MKNKSIGELGGEWRRQRWYGWGSRGVFPGGTVGKNPPADAGGRGFDS